MTLTPNPCTFTQYFGHDVHKNPLALFFCHNTLQNKPRSLWRQPVRSSDLKIRLQNKEAARRPFRKYKKGVHFLKKRRETKGTIACRAVTYIIKLYAANEECHAIIECDAV